MARRMTKFRINHIAAVDSPAQADALALIMKRDEDLHDGGAKTLAEIMAQSDPFEKEMAELAARNRSLRQEREGQTKGTTIMDTTTREAVLTEIAKHRDGLVIFAKQSLASNDPPMFTEAEATSAVMMHFKSLDPG